MSQMRRNIKVSMRTPGSPPIIGKGAKMNEMSPTASWAFRQPWRGVFAFVVTLFIAMVITVSCSIDSYLGLVSIWIMSMVPVQMIMTIGWGTKYPPADGLPQPWRGLALTSFMFLVGTVACFALLGFVAKGATQPFLSVYVICSVVMTIVATVSFGMWPYDKMSFPAKGFLTLITIYGIVYFGIRLFNFSVLSFPEGVNSPSQVPAPFYAPGGPLASFEMLAPKGPVPWETGLTIWLWIAFLSFTFVMLEFWPLNRVPKLMKQPTMGLMTFATTAIISWIVYSVGVGLLHIEPLQLMLYGVCYAFGLLVILVLFQRWPGRLVVAPFGAWINVVLSILVAVFGYHGVSAICTWHFGELAYPANIFARATFMLGLNFPLWVAYVELWECWPLPPGGGIKPS